MGALLCFLAQLGTLIQFKLIIKSCSSSYVFIGGSVMFTLNRLTNTCLVSILFCFLVMAALPSTAAVLTTDQATYTQGDIVYVTFLNDGDSEIYTVTGPPLGIMHVETGEWVRPYGMLPESVLLEPGEFLSFSHDTSYTETDPAGLYRASIQYGEGYNPTMTATTDYLLQEPVAATATTLDQLKCLFR